MKPHPTSIIRVWLLSVLLAAAAVIRAGDPLNQWHWLNPLPTGEDFSAVAFGGGTFVAVGLLGTIVSSTDGAVWTVQATPSGAGTFTGMAYGNGKFVVVGRSGKVLISNDGAHWQQMEAQSTQTGAVPPGFESIAFGNGAFVVAGYPNDIYYSKDGVKWAQAPFLSSDTPTVSFIDNEFIATTARAFFRSSNGADWTPLTPPGGLGGAFAYGNGLWLYQNAAAELFRSPDGTTWTDSKLTVPGQIVFMNGAFFAYTGRTVQTSTDGLAWSAPAPLQAAPNPYHFAFGDNHYVGAGDAGSLYASADGVRWTLVNPGSRAVLSGAAVGDGLIVVVGTDPYNSFASVVLTSADGKTWTQQKVPADAFFGYPKVAFGNGQFVAVDRAGKGAVATDGVNWKETAVPSGLVAVSFSSAASEFIGNDAAGRAFASKDGLAWAPATDLNSGLSMLRSDSGKFGDGQYVKMTAQGVANSANGLAWLTHAIEPPGSVASPFLDAVLVNYRVIVVGWGGLIMESDPVAPVLISPTLQRRDKMFQFSLVGRLNQTYRLEFSSDLSNWTELKSVIPTNQSLTISDSFWSNAPRRFYRVVQP